jgi:transcriptional regulator with XRE-family HTH domain
MILVRRVLGDVLRRRRQSDGRTLRQVAAAARISPGYLSEIERGQKEPSSELLASICEALDVKLSDVLLELSTGLAAAELEAAAQVSTSSLPSTRIPTAKLPARTPAPAQVTGGRPGVRGASRPAPRPVSHRVPVAAGSVIPAASTLTTNLPASIGVPMGPLPAGPGGVPGDPTPTMLVAPPSYFIGV